MAGLAILDPIHILPLSSPSSTLFTITAPELDLSESPLWDRELLKPPPFGPRAPSTSLTVPTCVSPADLAVCNAHRRLMDILNLTSEPHDDPIISLAQSIPSRSHEIPVIPTHHCLTTPPPYAMHSPLSSTHKTPFSSYRLRGRPTPTCKSTMTMSFKLAAPVPRIPLASVLQYWSSHESSKAQTGGDDASCKMHTDEYDYEYEFPDSALGLILGAAQGSQVARSHPSSKAHQHPYSAPTSHSHLHSHPQSQSQSRSRYSRRLRRLAPAPLQLAARTPRHTLRTSIQGDSPKCTPASTVFVDIPLNTSQSASAPSDLNLIPDIESESQQSQRRASMSSAMPSSESRAATSFVFLSATECTSTQQPLTTNLSTNTHRPIDGTGPSYIDLLTWRRTVSRADESPISPLRTPKSARCSVHTVSASIAAASPLKSASATPEFPLGMDSDRGVGSSDMNMAPPPLRRAEWVPLPQLSDEAPQSARDVHGEDGGEEVTATLPYCADLRLDLDVEDLMLRADKCAEAIGRASLSLRSCSLLKDPEGIAELCENLGQTFRSVQRALDETPTDFMVDGSDAKENWYSKHWELIESLNKNLNYFYLLVHQVEDRPPRIHRLAPLIDKLTTYQAKFMDLARKISISHEKLRLVNLRGQLTATHAHGTGRAHAYEVSDSRGRRDDRAARARQRELREEIRRVWGNIRAMRERHEAEDNDENMVVYDEDEDVDMAEGKDDKWKTR